MRRALVLLALLGLAITACGKSTKAATLSYTVAEPGAGKVTMTGPEEVKAGLVEVTLKNDGKQPHEAAVVRVDGNYGTQDVVDAVASDDPPPAWAHLEGGVAYVPPGQVKKATMNLLPGSYYVVEAGTDQEDNSFAKAGGIRPLRVTGAASKAGLPSASTTITASEYSFGVPGGLKAGTATVRFENKGRQPHFLLAVPVAAGKTFDEAKAAFTSGGPPSGPPPVDFEKATGAEYLDGGKSLVTTMSFEKGTYLFACFLTDRGGGPPHVELGMIQEVKVS